MTRAKQHRWFLRFSQVASRLTVPLFLVGMLTAVWLGRQYASELDLSLFWGFGGCAVVGAYLIARRPYHVVSWILAAIGLLAGIGPAAEAYAAYTMTSSGVPSSLVVFGLWMNGWYWYLLLALIMFYLPLFFPDGHLPSRRWRLVLFTGTAGTAGIVLLSMFADTLVGQSAEYQVDNPIGIATVPPGENHLLFAPLSFLFAVGVLGSAASVVVRFLRSQGVERQQFKWFLFAVALVSSVPLLDILSLLNYVPELGQDLILSLGLGALPTSIAVAILRYRLYDIDFVIRKTLLYASLTAVLALVFFGSVTLLQTAFSTVSGRQSSLATVLSTLAIAALFNPLRQRFQNLIDRRFYRRKYNAQQVLAAFAKIARNEMAMETLGNEMQWVVKETMQPSHVSLWLSPVRGHE